MCIPMRFRKTYSNGLKGIPVASRLNWMQPNWSLAATCRASITSPAPSWLTFMCVSSSDSFRSYVPVRVTVLWNSRTADAGNWRSSRKHWRPVRINGSSLIRWSPVSGCMPITSAWSQSNSDRKRRSTRSTGKERNCELSLWRMWTRLRWNCHK